MYTNAPQVQAYEPRTEVVGWDVDLADHDSMVLPGRATEDDNYRNHGVPYGARRKSITVTLRPALSGFVVLQNRSTKKILAIIAASSSGGGFLIETSADVILRNETTSTLTSNAAETTPDIGIAEAFFLDLQ